MSDGVVDSSEYNNIKITIIGKETAINNLQLKDYNYIAEDINHDQIINWLDRERVLYIIRKGKGVINQNIAATSRNEIKVINDNTSRKNYVNEIVTEELKAKFSWQEGSTSCDGYYLYSAESTSITVKDILDALPNKNTIIVRGEDKLNPTDSIAEGDSIKLLGDVDYISLEIAKITIQ